MSTLALELDAKMQSVDAETAMRLERLVREAIALADAAAVHGGDASHEERVKGVFAAMDAVKEFGAAGRLSREEIHAR
jgi:hypothetical protein